MVFRVVHFQIFWHWLILCKWMFTPDLSDWMAYCTPWFLGSGHSVDSVLAMGAHPLGNHMHFMPKSMYFINPALQRIMPICGFHWHSRYSIWISTFCFIALRVVPREFLWPQTVIFNNMSWKLVHCIKNSLNAKRSLYLLINFIFLCISSNWQWLQLFPIELKVVITQGFFFHLFKNSGSLYTLLVSLFL